MEKIIICLQQSKEVNQLNYPTASTLKALAERQRRNQQQKLIRNGKNNSPHLQQSREVNQLNHPTYSILKNEDSQTQLQSNDIRQIDIKCKGREVGENGNHTQKFLKISEACSSSPKTKPDHITHISWFRSTSCRTINNTCFRESSLLHQNSSIQS